MPQERLSFMFPIRTSVPPAETRAATALEFIAHYLDRIETHLEKLAASSHAGNEELSKIALQLTTVSHVLPQIVQK